METVVPDNAFVQLQALSQKVDLLCGAVQMLAAQAGGRVNRAALCERHGVHRNTLLRRLQTDGTFPRPGPDGKWSLADLVAWELKNAGAT